jgi:hypothetical protein
MLEQRLIDLGKRFKMAACAASLSRCSINARMTYTLMAIARSLRKMFAACNAPCSVNTQGL